MTSVIGVCLGAVRKEDKTPIDVILRRTRTLAETLKAMPRGPKLEDELKALAGFEADNRSGKLKDDAKEHFRKISALRRKIAFQNPREPGSRIFA